MADFDTIVMGSGAGGLTSALCLARAGQRVLVLERDSQPGGWCQTVEVDRYRFCPGIRYVGELGPEGRLRRIYEGLGVARDLTFFELNPDGVDHLKVGDERFDVPKGKDALAAALIDRFPHEANGIRDYLDLCAEVTELLGAVLDSRNVWKLARLVERTPLHELAGVTTHEELVGRFVSDPQLVRLLCAQTGARADRPALAPAALHAAVVGHLFGGGYYPLAGGSSIAHGFARALARVGAELRLDTAVDRILMERRHGRRRARGVRLADGSEITAERVISNVDPAITLDRLAGIERPGARAALPCRSSVAVTLMAAVELDLGGHGFDSGNLCYEAAPEADVPPLFISITSLMDHRRAGTTDGVHTLEALTTLPASAITHGANGAPDPTAEQEERLRRRMIDAVDAVIPGFAEALVTDDLDLQPTHHPWVTSTWGCAYATEKSPWQIEPWGCGVRTEIDDLLLCGTSTSGHGLMGATLSGLVVACDVLRCCPDDLLSEDDELTVLPSDSPQSWPIGY